MQNIPYLTKEKSVFQRGWPIFSDSWKNESLDEHIANLKNLKPNILHSICVSLKFLELTKY